MAELILPYWQFVLRIVEHHALNTSMFMRDLFANRINAFFALDVIVSAIVLLSFIQSEGQSLRMRLLWLPMLYSVHRCFAWTAAFLSLRQLQLDRTAV